MIKQNEDLLRMQFKSGAIISISWLTNHAYLTAKEIEEFTVEGVLCIIEKDPNDTLGDDKYILL